MLIIILLQLLFLILFSSPCNAMLCEEVFSKNYKDVCFNNALPALKTELMAYEIASPALEDFINGKLSSFDANGGDSQCQIRADKILDLHQNKDHMLPAICDIKDAVQQGMPLLKNMISQFASVSKNPFQMKQLSKIKIMDYLQQNGLKKFALSNDNKFLLQSHFVARYYQDGENKDVQNRRIKELSKVTELTEKNIYDTIRAARGTVNKTTMEYIIENGNKFGSESIKNGLKQKATFQSYVSIPCYIGFKVILDRLERKNIPILLKGTVLCSHGKHLIEAAKLLSHTDQIDEGQTGVFVCEGVADPTLQSNDTSVDDLYKKIGLQSIHDDQNCEMFTQWTQRFNSLSLKDILFANAALHYQHVDKTTQINFDDLKDLEREYEDHKHFAVEKGCCKEHMQTWRIVHIFADTVQDNA